MDALIIPVATYACETWTINKKNWSKIAALEMRFLRRIQNVKWSDHVTNVKIMQAVEHQTGNTRVDITTKLKIRQGQWFGHIMRMGDERLPKTILIFHQQQLPLETRISSLERREDRVKDGERIH